VYILLAIANGALAVESRIVNASLSDRIGDLGGSFVNHAVGWCVEGESNRSRPFYPGSSGSDRLGATHQEVPGPR
jgi:hypothetical protein